MDSKSILRFVIILMALVAIGVFALDESEYKEITTSRDGYKIVTSYFEELTAGNKYRIESSINQPQLETITSVFYSIIMEEGYEEVVSSNEAKYDDKRGIYYFDFVLGKNMQEGGYRINLNIKTDNSEINESYLLSIKKESIFDRFGRFLMELIDITKNKALNIMNVIRVGENDG